MQPYVFAERRLRLRAGDDIEEILVQFGPVTRQDGAAFCRYKVSGADGNLTRDIWGVDDVQAVELALKMAGSDLDRIADGGEYSIADTADGEAGHGMPSFIPTEMPKE